MKYILSVLLLIAIGVTSCAKNRAIDLSLNTKAKKLIERHVTFHTKANFKKHTYSSKDFYYTLEMDRVDEPRSVYWPDIAPKPSALHNKSGYTVELLEEKFRGLFDDTDYDIWSPQLLRVYDGERLLYDASVCSVHGIEMERKVVQISYGLLIFQKEHSKAMQADFPNTGMVLGGCCVDTTRPATHDWVCPICKYNEDKWEKLKKDKKD
jgi:hypothetical protein